MVLHGLGRKPAAILPLDHGLTRQAQSLGLSPVKGLLAGGRHTRLPRRMQGDHDLLLRRQIRSRRPIRRKVNRQSPAGQLHLRILYLDTAGELELSR
jgi:hypothetical protein